LGAQTALLLALTQGPGFGLELIARLALRSQGQVRLNRGGAYLALRRLESLGLVHGWMRKLPRSGRPRRYFELTPEGISRAEEIRRGLERLVQPSDPPATADEARRMAERVSESGALSAAVLRMRDAGRRAGLS
jgi:PadR family transcriptional regulator, regulatory protein PadR